MSTTWLPWHRDGEIVERAERYGDELTPAPPVVYVLADPAELVHLRAVVAALHEPMRKVAEHKRLGYERIKVGAFDGVADLLAGEVTP